MITSGMDERDECKRTSDDASKSNSDDIQTGMSCLFREQHGRDLLTGRAMSGV
jgi:hypothetical protein